MSKESLSMLSSQATTLAPTNRIALQEALSFILFICEQQGCCPRATSARRAACRRNGSEYAGASRGSRSMHHAQSLLNTVPVVQL